MTQTPLHIRAALPADVPFLRRLIQGLADYEREPAAPRLTEEELSRDGFGPEPAFTALVAEWDRTACGFALFFPIYSTWNGRSLYLEDLFVQPEYRGRGLGKALLTRVAAVAAETGCARLEWSVLKWNEPAFGFYESLGAIRMDGWERMRLAGQALAQVAGVAEQAVRGLRNDSATALAAAGAGPEVEA